MTKILKKNNATAEQKYTFDAWNSFWIQFFPLQMTKDRRYWPSFIGGIDQQFFHGKGFVILLCCLSNIEWAVFAGLPGNED